jgi:hypothetical protein
MTTLDNTPRARPHRPRRPGELEQPPHDDAGPADAEPARPGLDVDAPGWRLTDPAVEAAIAAFVATAPPLPEDLRARLARMLRTDHCHEHDDNSAEPRS